MDEALRRRATMFAALSEPMRLAIVDELACSDRSPGELAGQLEMSSNLLAHHLDVLVAAGLVERFASSGDRRRKYVRLQRVALRELFVDPGARPSRRQLRPMFVCSQNSARSQLAAAIWTARTGQTASSAGTRPAQRVHPGAVAAAQRIGLDISESTPSALGTVGAETHIVTVCDQAHEELARTSMVAPWHWSIPDPVELGTDAAFDETVRRLDDRIATFPHPSETRGAECNE